VYCALRLNLPRRTKRRVPVRLRQPLVAPTRLNEIWALDFMADALYDGRGFRTFNVLDEGNREALAIEIGTSIPSARVIRILDDLIGLYGRPARVRVDNGPELTAEAFVDWCAAQRIAIGYIQPGKPDQHPARLDLGGSDARAFAIDVLACPHCGGRLRLNATLHDPAVIRRILAHVGVGASGPSPGPAPPEPGAAAS
jgi:Integrase core domain